MQAKKRYLLLVVSCAFLAYWRLGAHRPTPGRAPPAARLASFLDPDAFFTGARPARAPPSPRFCTMAACFDLSRCRDDFRVYVYPPEEGLAPSPSYQKLLNVLTESRYYTPDPQRACLFVPSVDTLDRDSLSADYVRGLPARLARLPHWAGGRNHLIFNLYAGTWPGYAEGGLDFDAGRALLAKASMSGGRLRHDFDVSIPLFHKVHPEKGGQAGAVNSNNFPLAKTYLMAFKGKRYVHGIGSDTRNSLYHLHNRNDMIVVTTCRHGKSWKEMKDDRCDEDNREYDRYDYEVLLQNSTFCLVPRGRRLGSFRFLEALQAGCVPVILSNGWALPFSQVIDWSKAAIWADERLLLQVPSAVRSISKTKILQLRQQSQVLWDRYFSSIEKIVYTTLEIIRERLPNQLFRDATIWNNLPGALITLPNNSISNFFDSNHNNNNDRFYIYKNNSYNGNELDSRINDKFCAVIYCQLGLPLSSNSALYRLISNIIKSKYVSKVIVVWSNDKKPPYKSRWPPFPPSVTLHVVQPEGEPTKPSISQRFYPHPEISTAGVLSLDEDSVLTTDEIDFAFIVWRQFADRIVGYPARSHYWDDTKATWGYTSKWTNDYSIVLTGAAFYHQYYNVLYTRWLSPLLHKTVEQSQNCEDILMNFLVSHVTRRPPVKVTQRKQYKEQPSAGGWSPWNDPDHFIQRQTCLNTFAAVFGYMPLLRSNLRLDPVLFKDPVSIKRKKYRRIEQVGN